MPAISWTPCLVSGGHVLILSIQGVQVAGVTELVAQSAEDVMELLDVGNRNRTTEPTEANQTSSRSHAILQVVVEQKDKTADKVESIRIGKLSLIDLAGSERASITKNRGIRMIEGANINRSLLALGNCINALGANSSRDADIGRESYLPNFLFCRLRAFSRLEADTNVEGFSRREHSNSHDHHSQQGR